MSAPPLRPGRTASAANLLPLAAALLLTFTACQQRPEAAEPGGDPPMISETIVLWDGATLDGWSMAGPGAFVVRDGALLGTGGMGMLWYSASDFVDFELELEWRVDEADDNSGVFVRFPDPGDDPWIAVNGGYELQICDTAPDAHNTGSVYSFQGATSVPTKAPGAWNHYRIRVVGQQYTIAVNGVVVNEFTGERGERGYIGLQNHGDADAVYFRNLRVTPL